MFEGVETAFRNPQLFQHRVKVPLKDVAFTQRVEVPSLKNVPDFFLAYLLPQNPNEHGSNANSTNGIACLGCLYCAFFGLPIPNIAKVPALDSDALAAIRKREAKRAAEKAQRTPWENEQEAIRHSANTVKWRADEYRGGFPYWQSATEKPVEEHKIYDPEEVKKLKA